MLLVATLALLLPLGAAPAIADRLGDSHGDPHRPKSVSLHGTGGLTLSLPGYDGDPVRFTVDAHGPRNNPMAARGTFHVTHHRPDGSLLAEFSGTVDCLMSGGGTSVVTGVITEGSLHGIPDAPDVVGVHIGLTVVDGHRRDHIGWSWLVAGFEDVPPCTGTAPIFSVTEGGYRLRGDTQL